MSLSPDSSFSAQPLDMLSNIASSKSTPPTTVADSASLHSDTSKHDVITVAVEPESTSAADGPPDMTYGDAMDVDEPERDVMAAQDEEADTPGRSRRARGPAPVYNLAKLAGTSGHGKRRANGDVVSNRRRRTIGRATMIDQEADDEAAIDRQASKARRTTIDALNLQNSPRTRRKVQESPRPQRTSSRRAAAEPASPNPKKRARKSTGKTEPSRIPRELRRLQDTKEFVHEDDKPVVYTVWANGKYVDPKEAKKAEKAAAAKKTKVEETPTEEPEKDSPEPVIHTKQRRVKKYLGKGLYAGQDAPVDLAKGLTAPEKKKLAELPELIPSGRLNKTMPSPMFTGLRMLIAGRDFKLPYHICNPLPPGQPKPDEWKKMTKNRFIGDSKEIWRKSPHFIDMSKCVCKPEDGCGESCQNRIMLYECDNQNCNIGKENCTNRAFADLTARRAKGGKYRVGVEVVKTSDRGYGVRSNRNFRPHQIIMEYSGEIITEEECERRMNEVYKDNECYYLMSFDQNMIIDATTGSIARFVNHSCNPNCKMIKWIVSGQPRMALFAGDRPIATGDELTYDYNFDPFSAKNVQSCLCGEPNCRGVLGPKSKEPKQPIVQAVKATVKAGKRKLADLMGGDTPTSNKAKKPRITSTKGALANVGLQMAKGTATAIKNAANTAKKAALGSKTATKAKGKAGAMIKKTATGRVVKKVAKGGATKKQVTAKTTVADKANGVKAVKKTAVKKTTVKKPAAAKGMASAKVTGAKAGAKKSPVKKSATKKAMPKAAATKASVTKARAPKRPVAKPRMSKAEKMQKEELDRQYEITA